MSPESYRGAVLPADGIVRRHVVETHALLFPKGFLFRFGHKNESSPAGEKAAVPYLGILRRQYYRKAPTNYRNEKKIVHSSEGGNLPDLVLLMEIPAYAGMTGFLLDFVIEIFVSMGLTLKNESPPAGESTHTGDILTSPTLQKGSYHL